MQKKLLGSLCVIALAGCDSDAGNPTIIQTDQAQLVEPVPGPAFASALVTLPGRIEAEDFTSHNGIRLGDTNDSGNTRFVGHIENNDYVEYDIDVPTSGTYDLLARVGSLRNNATVNVIADDQNAGSFNVSPTGGWEVWETVSTVVNLSEGRQTLRLQFSGNANGLMNINWFSLALRDADASGDDNGPGDDDGPGDDSVPGDDNGPVTPTEGVGTDRELDSTGWTLTANRNSDNAFLALDANSNTRWTTGQAQGDGMSFTIELNSREIFDRLILDSSVSNGDYPREYEVEVSTNGSQWSTVAAGTGTTNGVTVIDFADQNASYVRVQQTGSASRSWWSIHEMGLFANSTDAPPPDLTPEDNSSESTPESDPESDPDDSNDNSSIPGAHPDIVRIIEVAGREPRGVSWHDSYSVGDTCYISSNLDHDVASLVVDTPFGRMTVPEVDRLLDPGPGREGNPIYNDVQCGNGPFNNAGDEHDCPGRVDIGRAGCGHIGPKWNFTKLR